MCRKLWSCDFATQLRAPGGSPAVYADGRAYMGRCHNCGRKYARKKRTPKRTRERHLRKSYGIGVDDFDSMWEDQGGRCRTCDRVLRRSGAKKIGCRDDTAVVDHCHDSGAVRGLLCHRCNMILGFIEKHGRERVERLLRYSENGGLP